MDLEQNVFTIGSGNKGKYGNLLRTSKEKLAVYFGINYGDNACQEWKSEKQLVLQESTYPDSVLARHAVQEKAVIERVTKCCKPSVQPRDAARREECSDLDEKSLTTFCC
jgi:hypothetical protein